MEESLLREKSKKFAKEIVLLVDEMNNSKNIFALTNQLLRSGTSIGANIYEAHYAQSCADFVSKLEIALKECFESEYWLELLKDTGYLSEDKYSVLVSECGIMRRMLVASCRTAKSTST